MNKIKINPNAIFLSSLLLLICLFSNIKASAQSVFRTDLRGEAQVKVYLVDLKGQADLVAYDCSYPGEATGNNGLWYIVNLKGQANKTYFIVDNPGEADIKVFQTQIKGEAGWINKSKAYLMQY